jgi:hypothetical protein
MTGHLAIFHASSGVSPTTEGAGRLLGEVPGEDGGDGHGGEEHEHDDRDEQLEGSQLPERPALLDLVDRV